MSLSHDRKVGIFTFVFHQALYSMGLTGVFKGFSLISYHQKWYKCGTDEHMQMWCKVPRHITVSGAAGGVQAGLWWILRFSLLLSARPGILETALVPVYLASSASHQQFLLLFQSLFPSEDCLLELLGTNYCVSNCINPMRNRHSWFLLHSLFRRALD